MTTISEQALYELWMYGQADYYKGLTAVNPFFVIDGEYQINEMEIEQ
jgi:hypothetical protein